MDRKFFRIDVSDYFGHGSYRFFLNLNHRDFPRDSQKAPCYGSSFRFVVQKKSLFRNEVILPDCLYAYEENNTFYEFFSGKIIGTRQATPPKLSYYVTSHKPYYESSPDEILRKGYILTSFGSIGSMSSPIKELSAAKFKEEVDKYVPYRAKMAVGMSELLDAIDANYARLANEVRAKEDTERQAEHNSRKWLDDMINKR